MMFPRRQFLRLPGAAARLAGDCRGSAAVEFAMLLPVLVLVIAGVIDAGRLISRNMQVKAAVQAGADLAARKGWDQAAVENAVASATPLTVSPTPAPRQITACASGVTLTETTATTCPSGAAPGRYVMVEGGSNFSPLVPWPGLPGASELRAKAAVRVR